MTATNRSTAPQSSYTRGQLLIGFVVLLLGLAVVFGVPLVETFR